MKTIKVLVLTLALGLAGYTYAAGDTQSSTECSNSDKARAACCVTDAGHCKTASDCCKPDAGCCPPGAECCKTNSACRASDAKCCEPAAKDDSKTASACCGVSCKGAHQGK